jgi:MoxR-like ATPase
MTMSAMQAPTGADQGLVNRVKDLIGQRLFGLERPVEELFIGLLAEGHILLEDVPGVGKTALARAFSSLLGLDFKRIQCTPDMLPADIVGGLIYNPKTGDFSLRKGPVFTNILLVDEINRALPRTQSALLEAMAERQVTIDGETHVLSRPFLVIATQNPIESQGVFPLPEAQLDRFLIKTTLGYPQPAQDVAIMHAQLDDVAGEGEAHDALLGSDGFVQLLDAVRRIRMSDEMLDYVGRLVRATRVHPDVLTGASPRAMLMLARAARAAAFVACREYVKPDDVMRVAPLVLYHRLVLQGHATLTPSAWMEAFMKSVPVPVDEAAR